MNELCDNPNPKTCELYENGCFIPSRECEFRNVLKSARYWLERAKKERENMPYDYHSAQLGFITHALENIVKTLESGSNQND